MAKSYVTFAVSADVAAKTLEALQLAKQSGVVRKGANEVTKSIERGLATFVVLAEDIEPEEVVVHIPKLCEQKKVAISFVPTKLELGKAIGMNVPCAAVAVEKEGTASGAIKDVIAKTTGSMPRKAATAEAPKEEKKPAAPRPKKEEKKEEKKAEVANA